MGRLVRVSDCGIVWVGEGGVRVLGGGGGGKPSSPLRKINSSAFSWSICAVFKTLCLLKLSAAGNCFSVKVPQTRPQS